LDCVVRKLNEEHFLLLVGELVNALGPLLGRELNSRLGNVDRSADEATSLRIIVVDIFFSLRWLHILILYSLKRHPRRGGLLIPNLKMLVGLLRLFLPLLLRLPRDEDLLLVWRLEW
jgi:hypothetical protein